MSLISFMVVKLLAPAMHMLLFFLKSPCLFLGAFNYFRGKILSVIPDKYQYQLTKTTTIITRNEAIISLVYKLVET